MSIHKQSFKNFEVWIIDGGSTDDTLNYLKSLHTPFYWLSEKDNGIYEAMNKGIKLASGEWMYFLGVDDRLYSFDTFENIFTPKIKPFTDLIIGNVKYCLEGKDSNILKRNSGVFKSSWNNNIWLKNIVHHQSVFYNRRVFTERNYSLEYSILSDYYINLILFQLKSKVLKINSIIAICGTKGVSKKYNWNLYSEEIKIKTELTSSYLKPIFFLLGLLKFITKKVY